MAAQIVQTLVGSKPKYKNSANETFDFLSVKIGASAMEIKETGGAFDFGARNLLTSGTVDGRDVSTDGATLDAHLNGAASKHDATEVDYEQTDGSKKDIQASSDDVENALRDLDNFKISRTGSIPMTGSLNFGGFEALNAADPSVASSLATKSYVDSVRVFSRIMGNVKAATTANIALTGLQTIDTYVGSDGDAILVWMQTDPTQNGVYRMHSGAWTRDAQLDNSPVGEIYNGVLIPKVLFGTAYVGKAFVITSQGTGTDDLHTIGTDAITFSQFTPASALSAGDGINTTSFSSNIIAVQVSQLVGDGIEDDGSNNFRVKLNGATLNRSASGIKVSTAGITDVELASASVKAVKFNADAVGEGNRLNASTNAIERDDAQALVNDNAGTLTIRQLVYIKSNGHVDLARANALATADSQVGFVEDASILTTATGKIVTRDGARVSGFTGLTIGQPVYVDAASAGAYTQTAPTTATQVIKKVGVALSATVILLEQTDAIEILS